MGQHSMKEPDGVNVIITEDGLDYLIEPNHQLMDDLMGVHRLICDGSRYRAKATVHRFEVWSQAEERNIVSRRYATEAGINTANGEAIPNTAVEIDSKDLEPDGWTIIDYLPRIEVKL